MKGQPRQPPTDLAAILRIFKTVPELKSAGALAGATALHHEHLENRLGRFSFDIDLQNQAEEIESVHRRFSLASRSRLRLIGRLSDEFYQYQARAGRRVVRVDIARPYLRHRKQYQPSRHVPGLLVVSLADLLFAKISAYSTRGLPRDLLDLFAVDQQKQVDWKKLLLQAAKTVDNDYNPAEFHRKLQSHQQECPKSQYWEEVPFTRPPSVAELLDFIGCLLAANRAVARSSLG